MNEYNDYNNEYQQIDSSPEKKPIIKTLKWVLCVILGIAIVVLIFWLLQGNNKNNNQVSPLADEIFYNNIIRMKDAATSYYTLERLPGEEGKTKTLTLQQMIDMNLVLPLKNSEGKKCDTTKSYVEVTKLSTEYQMKIYLSCGSQEDYIVVYMGCYDYCKNFICEKQETTSSGSNSGSSTSTTPTKPVNKTNPSCSLKVVSGSLSETGNSYISNVVIRFGSVYAGENSKLSGSGIGTSINYSYSSYTVTKDGTTKVYGYVKNTDGKTATCSITINKTTPTVKRYEYLYKKSVATEYSNWSDWSANKEYTSNDNIIWGKQELVWNEKNGSKDETSYTYKKDTNKPIWQTTYDNQIGTQTTYGCDGYNYFVDKTTSTTYQYGSYSKTGTLYHITYVPQDTMTKHYVLVGIDFDTCNDTCTSNPVYNFDVYERSVTAQTKSQADLSVTCNVVSKTVPVYGAQAKLIGFLENRIATTKTIYYYHTKTRTLIKKAYTSEIWSSSSNDTNLIGQGYSYTGTKREI